MASISGASRSNTTSSLYNSANVISGLASGLDTEGMIENLVKGYQTKINTLNQKVTKTEWKQDAYRSIIQKMVGFSSKYTSYTSSTNLMSASFFNSAVKVAAQGLYADKVTASGKTSSDIVLNSVKQLAAAAQYRTGSNLKAGDGRSIEAEAGVDLKGKTTLGSLSGSLTLTYGSNNITLSFDEVADKEALEEIKSKYKADNNRNMSETEALAALINQKLEGQKISFSGGTSADAKDRIEVRADGNTITFADKSSAGNSVYLSGASGNVEDALGLDLENAKEDKPAAIKLNYDFSTTKEVNNAVYLSEKTMNLSLDGSTRQIKLPKITGSESAGYKIVDNDGKALDYTAENYYMVKAIPGVLRFLGPDGLHPSTLTYLEAEWIKLLAGEGKPLEPTTAQLTPEGEVKLGTGILQHFPSRIKKIDKHSRRATVELSVCGEKRIIPLSFNLLSE